MSIKYQARLKEYGFDSLDHEDLAVSFMEAAKEFEKKRTGNELSDEEISKGDDELLKLFDDVHNIKTEDSDEVKKLKAENLEHKGKDEVLKTDDPEALKALKEKYKGSPGVITAVDQKVSSIEAYQSARQEAEEATDVEVLTTLKEKHSQYKELCKGIDAKISSIQKKADIDTASKKKADAKKKLDDEVKAKSDAKKTLHDKLLSNKKEWDYDELRSLGIEPTGNDMTVEGVCLERQFMYNVYIVNKSRST